MFVVVVMVIVADVDRAEAFRVRLHPRGSSCFMPASWFTVATRIHRIIIILRLCLRSDAALIKCVFGRQEREGEREKDGEREKGSQREAASRVYNDVKPRNKGLSIGKLTSP